MLSRIELSKPAARNASTINSQRASPFHSPTRLKTGPPDGDAAMTDADGDLIDDGEGSNGTGAASGDAQAVASSATPNDSNRTGIAESGHAVVSA
ncbi:MAG TPA: hypothetical protein VIL81_04375, partial [Candidatus Limnocylindrales bacterium]